MTVITAAHRSSAALTPEELARLDASWSEGTQRWAALSTASDVVTVQDTGHEIQVDHPSVVATEIAELLSRSGTPAPRTAQEGRSARR